MSWRKLLNKFNLEKWPSRSQWKKLPFLISPKERYFIIALFVLLAASLLTWHFSYQAKYTTLIPKHGGTYTEGIIGNPQYINPVLAQANDVDQDISELIFSGLMKYNSQGKLVPDLAQDYRIGEEGKIYEFDLRKNITWHDGKPFTADDVLFTINTIQDPDYRSPLISNWNGVKVEKVDDYTIRFTLDNPYAPFLNNATVQIIPKHIWKNVLPAEFLLAEANLKPVGTGPYKFEKFEKSKRGAIKTIHLAGYENYHLGRPYIKSVIFNFYVNEENLISAYNQGKVDGLGFLSAQNQTLLKRSQKLNIYSLKLPRYFTVFFNQSQSKALSEKTVRLALNYATNKQEIIDQVLNGQGVAVYSPIPSGVFGHSSEIKKYEFALEHANNLLEAADWTKNEQTGIREKVLEQGEDPVPLEINLATTEWPELKNVANIIQQQWLKLGVQVNLKILSIAEIQQEYIRPREYQALLFGEVLGAEPDPFPFWHSSQKRDPGLNLSLYQNKEVDQLLKEARQISDPEQRKQEYEQFQKLVIEDAPVVFLYNPYYLYPVNKKVNGIEIKNIPTPSKRFSGIENWHIKTKRVRK